MLKPLQIFWLLAIIAAVSFMIVSLVRALIIVSANPLASGVSHLILCYFLAAFFLSWLLSKRVIVFVGSSGAIEKLPK